MSKMLASEGIIVGAADAVHHLRARAGQMALEAKCMAAAMHQHRADLTHELLSEQVSVMLRNQAGLWDAVSTLSDVLDALVIEPRPPRHLAH
jgi:hypothetical protein